MCVENKLYVEIITVNKFVRSFTYSEWKAADVNTLRFFFFFHTDFTEFKVDRQKRQANNGIIASYIACTAQSTTNVVMNCPFAKWNLSCKMRSRSCYYYITCVNLQPRSAEWQCSQRHLSNRYPICCDLTCPNSSPLPQPIVPVWGKYPDG